jgi:polar amino acid transport system substrate-binding protein
MIWERGPMARRVLALQILFFGVAIASFTGLCITPLLPVLAAELPAIRKRGRLIVGVKANAPLLGFRTSSGQLQGLEIDLANRLAEELLRKPGAVELKPVLNSQRLTAVLEHQVDLTIAQVTLTPSRSRVVRFSLPYYTDGAMVLTNRESIRQQGDLRTQAIAVLDGSSTVEVVRRQLPSARLVGVRSYAEAKALLQDGTVAAVAADATVLSGWLPESSQYRLISPKLSTELLCVVLPKGQQYDELTTQVNQILSRLRTTGWLAERANYWGLPPE